MVNSNAFQSFAFDDSQDSPVKSVSLISRRPIVFSDDELSSPQHPSSSHTDSRNPWLDSRNATTISNAQKEANIQTALNQRRALKVTNSDDSTSKLPGGKPNNKPNSYVVRESQLYNILNEDYDPLVDHRRKLEQAQMEERSRRVQKRELATVDLLSSPAVNSVPRAVAKRQARNQLDSSGDDSDEQLSSVKVNQQRVVNLSLDSPSPVGKSLQRSDDPKRRAVASAVKSNAKSRLDELLDSDDGDGGEIIDELDEECVELTAEDIRKQAMDVIQQCELVSASLRESLNLWKGEKRDKHSGDCVDLMNIDLTYSQQNSTDAVGSQHQTLISDSDIARICPGLRLNGYQLVGVNWLRLLYENDVNGVLADDMGLGKTVQSISFLGWLSHHKNAHQDHNIYPHLIVVPASVLANWQNEFQKFCPSLRVFTYHGSQDERHGLRQDLRRSIPRKEVDVVLCTYTIFERDACKQDRSFLCNQQFDFLILDEAHCIKNADSSRFFHLNAINTKHRLLLSGTPVQNDLSELLAMLSFLMPTVFGRAKCELLLLHFGWSKDRKKSLANSKESLPLQQLKSMLAPFVLRRLKRDVLDQLTEKHQNLVLMPMIDTQHKVYDGIISRYAMRKQRVAATVSKGKLKKSKSDTTAGDSAYGKVDTVDLSASGSSGPQQYTADDVLHQFSGSEAKHLFTALRKAANHPLLLRVHYTDSNVVQRIAHYAYEAGYFGEKCTFDRVMTEMETFSDYDIHLLCLQYESYLGKYSLSADTLFDSPKMKYLRDVLPRLQSEGHRMLLFSQWTRLLDLLEVLLNSMDMRFLRLDGSTPIAERQHLIDEYSNDSTIPVFLLSTKAGGLGINLTAADTVILHDLDFNPENDKQAEDRCHRIGQTRPVTIYRLVCQGTVDEDIHEMGEHKRQLSQAVLSDDRHHDHGKNKRSAGKDDDDLNMISKILARALSK